MQGWPQDWLHCLQAYLMLDNGSPAVMRDPVVGEAVARVLAAGALRFGQLEGVTAALFNLLNKHEHLPAPLAHIAAFSARRNDDNRLVGPGAAAPQPCLLLIPCLCALTPGFRPRGSVRCADHYPLSATRGKDVSLEATPAITQSITQSICTGGGAPAGGCRCGAE